VTQAMRSRQLEILPPSIPSFLLFSEGIQSAAIGRLMGPLSETEKK